MKCVVELSVSSTTSFETFEDRADFKKTKVENLRMLSLINIILLRPFSEVALLSLLSRGPSKMAQTIPVTSLGVKSKLPGHDGFDTKDHSTASNCVLGFLWCD